MRSPAALTFCLVITRARARGSAQTYLLVGGEASRIVSPNLLISIARMVEAPLKDAIRRMAAEGNCAEANGARLNKDLAAAGNERQQSCAAVHVRSTAPIRHLQPPGPHESKRSGPLSVASSLACPRAWRALC